MKKLTQEQINKILEEHKHWLNKDCDGWENMKADFSECDLRSADLCSANLYYANLRSANLCSANLRSANLRSANLCSADLCSADLRYADLCSADLCSANLYYANLRSADLRSADLCSADLRYANLRSANLYYANLCSANLCSADLCSADLRSADLCSADLCSANLYYANLRSANLYYANLCSADLRYAKEISYIPMVCPEEGDFIGWKKARDKIVKLHIPENALRSSSTTRKCRCNKAEVIEIFNLDGTVAEERQIASDRDSDFIYEVGKIVEVTDFDTNRWEECTRGIHFFINRQEAINYN